MTLLALAAAAAFAASAGDLATRSGTVLGAGDACELGEARMKQLDKLALKMVVRASRDDTDRSDALMTYASVKAEALAAHIGGSPEECAKVGREVDALELELRKNP